MKKGLTCLLPAILLAAGVMYAAVHADYDRKANFGGYRTYSWIGLKAGNSLWQDRIMGAVDSQMAARGLTRVESGGDISIAAFGRTTEHDTLHTFYDGFPGWGWRAGWWGMGSGMATAEVIPEPVGNLTVDIFDGHTKQLVWRGMASEVLSEKPDKNEKKLEKAVDEMFKKFPPKERG